ncbi:hypothetical protein AQ436_13200 [Arthrobacter sp. EpRS66]|nr:hypothetical protein AQ436_13200 [Arthrobacter sp. EpRS66]
MPQWADIVPVTDPVNPKYFTGDPLPMIPDEIGLRLRNWNQRFLENFDELTGWKVSGMGATHRAEAEELQRDLKAALGDDFGVEIDGAFW